MYIEHVMSSIVKILSCAAVRNEGGAAGAAGEAKLVGIPNFHSWGKFTMPLTNTQSDWMSDTSSGLCITLNYHISLISSTLELTPHASARLELKKIDLALKHNEVPALVLYPG